MRHILLVLLVSSALSDMTVLVKRGENVTLPARTPGMRDVKQVTLWSRYENGTPVAILRYCSIKEKERGCTAIGNDRLKLQLGSENVSVVILDARATDAGTRVLEVFCSQMVKETFTIVFNGSSGSPSTTASPPSDDNTVTIVVVIAVVIAVLIIIVVVTVVCVYLYKKKNREKLGSCDYTKVNSEVADTQSSIIEADELNTDASSEEDCLVEKKPEDLDSTQPDAHNLISSNSNNSSSSSSSSSSNNNNNNNNNNSNSNNDNKDVIIHINNCYMKV